MDLPRLAKRVGTAALVTGVLLAVAGTVWGRWAMWRMLVDADPQLADLPLRALLSGTGPAVLEIRPRQGSILTAYISIPPIWHAAVPFVIAGSSQVIGGLAARSIAPRNGRRAVGALVACSVVGLLVSWPFNQPPAIVAWLSWACPAVLLTALAWGLAARVLARRDRRGPDGARS